MLYFADDAKETKIAKITSAIEYVKSTLTNEMEKWERREYDGVLAAYELELKNVTAA